MTTPTQRTMAQMREDNARLTAERDRLRAALERIADRAEAGGCLNFARGVRAALAQPSDAEPIISGEGARGTHSPASPPPPSYAQPPDAGTYRWDDPHADPDAEREA